MSVRKHMARGVTGIRGTEVARNYPFSAVCFRISTFSSHPYRDRLKGVQILLSNSQAGTGRNVKQEQEEISRNNVQAFLGNLCTTAGQLKNMLLVRLVSSPLGKQQREQRPSGADRRRQITNSTKRRPKLERAKKQ